MPGIHIDFRLRTRYVDYKTRSLDEALAMIEKACAEKKPSLSACWAMPLS
jgi:urocanate hydratase